MRKITMISGWVVVVLLSIVMLNRKPCSDKELVELSMDCGKLLYERSILECKKKYDNNFTYETLQEIYRCKRDSIVDKIK